MGSNPVEAPKSLLFFDALKIALGLVAAGSVAAAVTGRGAWIGGMWLTLLWIAANAYVLKRLLLDVASGKLIDKQKIQLVLLIKFPVLYMIGFLALYFRWARLEGAAAAFTAYIAACGLQVLTNQIKKKTV